MPLVSAALLAIACGQAHAQSSVTIFGVADIGYVHTSANGTAGSVSRSQLASDGNTSSRLGFRGTEDLRGGMKAGFWLEGALAIDQPGSLTLQRRSTVELSGSFGEVRLGRDYVPTFTNLTVAYHPFGTNGVGNAGQLFYPVAAGGTTSSTHVRSNNGINYFSPNVAGYQANVMYAFGEHLSNEGATKQNDTYVGGRVSYANGPLNLSAATGKTKFATGDYTQSNFAANYQLGAAKLMYLWGENKVGVTKTTSNLVGVQYKVSGTGEVRAAYTDLKAVGVANDATQMTVGYVHNLSKRTALYTNYSVVDNKGTGKQFVVGGGDKTTVAGGNTTGYEFGVRHSF
ncbi:porin [Limnohabitans sp. JUR4]|uniref:Porin n=1 Tax=Limnohabitans radicicola TaxID=2771427 RepID=A0A927IIE0_9BURK|nr:porin [Limnohabitans radicicola]